MLELVAYKLIGRLVISLGAGASLLLVAAHASAQEEPLTAPQPGETPAATAPMAPPETPDPSARRHDGFYLRIATGPAVAFGKYEPDEGDSWDVSGGGGAFDFALGGTIATGVVLGGGLWGMGTISTKYKDSIDADGAELNLGMIGPFLDYYFNEKAGGHVMLALGFAGVSQQEGEDFKNGAQFAGGGLGVLCGGGYEWWVANQWSIGVIARLQYVAVKTENEMDPKIEGTISLLSPAIMFGVTYH